MASVGYQAKPVVFDDTLGVPEVVVARKAAQEGDFRSWVAAVEACSTYANRHAAIWTVGERSVSAETVNGWASAAPDAPLAVFAKGVRLVEDGWEIRTGRDASQVSSTQRQAFLDHLAAAETAMERATVAFPDSPIPWSILLACGLGLERQPSTLEERYRAAVERGGGTWRLHGLYLQTLTQKWGGSHEAMFAFARSPEFADGNKPERALLCQAHLECSLGNPNWFNLEEVRDELAAIAQSVWSPGFPKDIAGLYAHNTFACVLWRANLSKIAAPHTGQLGLHFARLPWMYFPNPHHMAERAHREAVAAGHG